MGARLAGGPLPNANQWTTNPQDECALRQLAQEPRGIGETKPQQRPFFP